MNVLEEREQARKTPVITGGFDAAVAKGKPGTTLRKAVVVHGGARDAYQLAIALEESGQLEALITDVFYADDDPSWFSRLAGRLPQRWFRMLQLRQTKSLPIDKVLQCQATGLAVLALERLKQLPFSVRRLAQRFSDAHLGTYAGDQARERGAALVTYSYTGYHAFAAYGAPAMLFQAHPHPATMREILREELRRHPECIQSLQQEWELALPEGDFERLVEESARAAGYMVASTFSKQSLVANGVAPETIEVIPYGVDLQRFHPGSSPSDPRLPLELLFVGRINQRKGVTYLVEALRAFSPDEVRLTICGRVVDDLSLFAGLSGQITIRPSVSADELVAAYQKADLFVFPSVGEGFGQVLLESLASGLPILSTTHTAAPDLIDDGVHGFITQPRDVHHLVECIRWAATHREELATMGVLARQRAEQFTWQRFRDAASQAVRRFIVQHDPTDNAMTR